MTDSSQYYNAIQSSLSPHNRKQAQSGSLTRNREGSTGSNNARKSIVTQSKHISGYMPAQKSQKQGTSRNQQSTIAPYNTANSGKHRSFSTVMNPAFVGNAPAGAISLSTQKQRQNNSSVCQPMLLTGQANPTSQTQQVIDEALMRLAQQQ